MWEVALEKSLQEGQEGGAPQEPVGTREETLANLESDEASVVREVVVGEAAHPPVVESPGEPDVPAPADVEETSPDRIS